MNLPKSPRGKRRLRDYFTPSYNDDGHEDDSGDAGDDEACMLRVNTICYPSRSFVCCEIHV